MKTRMQLDSELYEVIKGKCTKELYRVLYGAYHERSLKSIDNEQLEKLINLVRHHYGSTENNQTPKPDNV